MRLVARLLVGMAVCACAMAGPAYPLKQSANGRYLVDQHNTPFLMLGDAPQSLMVNLSDTDAAAYFLDRQQHGFNTLWVNLLCTTYTGGRSNSSTIDGIVPFTNTIPNTSSYDLSTPNPDYFAHADRMIKLAATYGMQIILDPIETGGYLGVMANNGTIKCRAYGQYIGNRYKDFPNILWMSGNDFQTWRTASDDAVVVSVAQGILDQDTNHLHSIELDYPVSSSLDDTNWASIVRLNAAYTYKPTYAEVLHAYGQSSTTPVFMVEANYEFETNPATDGGSAFNLRLQEYWTQLSGACGQLYGNHYTWSFVPGWQTKLDTIGVTQLGYMKALFESRPWFQLIPDTGHVVVTSGYGTFSSSGSIDGNDYAAAASTGDGTLAMAYMPTVRTLTVNMTRMSGAANARWYDPGNGKYVPIAGSPFANTGSRDFTPPGRNSAGDGDWILVLETAPVAMLPPPGTYIGLFLTEEVEQGSAGLLMATVTPKGKYSGRIQIGRRRYGFSGVLGLQPQIANVVPRRDDSPLELNLNFGSGTEADELRGQITNGLAVATLQAARAAFDSRTNPAYTSRFTLKISGQPGDSSVPAGDGIGAGRVRANGLLTFGAILADGTPFSQGVALTKDNQWPLYAPLYSGNGSVFSSLAFDTNQPGGDIQGSVAWIKPGNPSTRYYPFGFTNQNLSAVGSLYSPPAAGSTVLGLTAGSVQFNGGNLVDGLTNAVAIGPRSRVTDLAAGKLLAMSFSLAAGTFAGRVADPVTGKLLGFKGVILPKLDAGSGFLLGSNQTSQVLFTR
jgi:hypothetical protein